MSYQQFKEQLSQNHKMPKVDYYYSLYQYRSDIIKDVALRNQEKVAKDLNIHQTKLSYILNLLKAIETRETNNSSGFGETNNSSGLEENNNNSSRFGETK